MNATTETAHIRITQAAAEHIQTSLAQRGKGVGIRLGIKTSGCSGLAYVIEYVDTPNDADTLFSKHGVSVYVDTQALVYLQGTTLDFKTQGLNSGLDLINPNVKDSCGCGESFTV